MKIGYLDRRGAHVGTDMFGVFAALAGDTVTDFPALRAHQRHPWHAFTVQCAALAMTRSGVSKVPDTAEGWRNLLIALTPDQPDGAAWALIGEDWNTPALLQPPGMDPGLMKTSRRAMAPDGLDMLLTARNHDLKSARIGDAEDDDWLFALVSLQTQEGQMGAGNYGISRMNGGYGARVGLSLRPAADRPGRAFRRDLDRLLAMRPAMPKGGSIGLLWLEPWDGTAPISFRQLDPWYVEICRRVRLVHENGRIAAILANSKTARTEAKTLKGLTGDPWAPVDRKENKSWGISERGFGYHQMVDLLDPEKISAPLAEAVPEDCQEGLTLLARAVARGQGKTEGYHERCVPIPPRAVSLFTADACDGVPRAAKARRDEAKEAADILRHALRVLAQGGPAKPRHDDPATATRIARFEELFETDVDRVFFDTAFWDHAADEDEMADHLGAWRRRLRDFAESALHTAEGALPRSELRRLRAVSRARSVFHGRMRRFFEPDAIIMKERRDA